MCKRATPVPSSLYVEDDDGVRKIVTKTLSVLGYCVIAAASGLDALAVLTSGRRIDLLFTDAILSGPANGAQLATKAQTLRPRKIRQALDGTAPKDGSR